MAELTNSEEHLNEKMLRCNNIQARGGLICLFLWDGSPRSDFIWPILFLHLLPEGLPHSPQYQMTRTRPKQHYWYRGEVPCLVSHVLPSLDLLTYTIGEPSKGICRNVGNLSRLAGLPSHPLKGWDTKNKNKCFFSNFKYYQLNWPMDTINGLQILMKII